MCDPVLNNGLGAGLGADNTGVFRDIKKRGKRKVLELDPAGRKIVEVRSYESVSAVVAPVQRAILVIVTASLPFHETFLQSHHSAWSFMPYQA